MCDKSKIQINYDIEKIGNYFVCYVTRVKLFGIPMQSLLFNKDDEIVMFEDAEDLLEYINSLE